MELFSFLGLAIFLVLRIRSIAKNKFSYTVLGLYCGIFLFYVIGGFLGYFEFIPVDYNIPTSVLEEFWVVFFDLIWFILIIECCLLLSMVFLRKSYRVDLNCEYDNLRASTLFGHVTLLLAIFILYAYLRYGGFDGIFTRLLYGRKSDALLFYGTSNVSDGSFFRLLVPIIEAVFLCMCFYSTIVLAKCRIYLRYLPSMLLVLWAVLSGVRSDLIYFFVSVVLVYFVSNASFVYLRLLLGSVFIAFFVIIVYSTRVSSDGLVDAGSSFLELIFLKNLCLSSDSLICIQETTYL